MNLAALEEIKGYHGIFRSFWASSLRGVHCHLLQDTESLLCISLQNLQDKELSQAIAQAILCMEESHCKSRIHRSQC